jgi:hypothetical protein
MVSENGIETNGIETSVVAITELRHIGLVVNNIEEAIADLGAVFGIGWTGRQQAQKGGVYHTKSTGPGPCLELIEARNDTIWNGDWIGVQHISVRVDVLPVACQHLESLGAEQITRVDEHHPEEGSVYYRLRSGLLVEISTLMHP